jgi:cell division protease FtsH
MSDNNKNISNKTMELIDKKVKDVLDKAYKIAINLINKNKVLHEKISKDLLKKEEITREEFEEYFIKR